MKRFALAIALACVLSGSVLAGDAHSVGAPAPAPGDVHTTGAPERAPRETQGSGIAATVILTILSLVR
jgi:hypothetical protein